MSNQNYTLDIISHHPKFEGKSLRKYQVEGIETIGAWGDENFGIQFKNNTYQKVQIKLSIDGTDIMSGEKATTDVDKNMWVVNGYGTLSLKAWPEDGNGGAAFIFSSANNSVAVHTHGDLSSRGIIAAAVFVEGHVEPIKVTPPVVIDHHHYHRYPYYPIWPTFEPYWVLNNSSNTLGGDLSRGSSISYNSCSNNVAPTSANYYCNTNADSQAANKSLENLVAVGAGSYVDQKITYVTGLIKPTFTETVRVRYLWWDELQTKLREHNMPAPHASGFPGDKQRGINLGNTPRIGSPQRITQQEMSYSRF